MSTMLPPVKSGGTPGKTPLAPSIHTGLDIASMIFAFVFPPLGIIFGAVSMSTAQRDGRNPSGLARAGVIIGVLSILAVVIAFIAIKASQPDAAQQYFNCLNHQLDNPSLVCNPPG